MHSKIPLLGACLALFLLPACDQESASDDGEDSARTVTVERTGFLSAGQLMEASGLQASHARAGDFFVHNDDGEQDLYAINHPGVRHIYEDSDGTVGNHFVFIIHRDIDIDRDRVENDDRQRNEIKTYGGSEEAVKGYENETFVYRWKFRINPDMEVSTRFTHLFQL